MMPDLIMHMQDAGLRTRLLLVALLVTQNPGVVRAGAPGHDLTGFHAEYKLKYGLIGGDVFFDLTYGEQDDVYIYETRTTPRGLARVVVRESALERSEFRLTDTGLQPLRYLRDDGSGKDEDRTDIRFDWARNMAFSEHEGENFSIPLEEGTLDRLSADILAMMDLRSGRTPGSYAIADGEEIDIYNFEALGEDDIEVKAGSFRALKFKRQRAGSSRSTLIWYAPAADYLPVRIEQQKKGKTVVTMVATLLESG